MKKYFLLILIILPLVACATKDAHYYQLNPKALQKALDNCPKNPPAGMRCEALASIAQDVNHLGYLLQTDPQGFGQKIIAMQTTLSEKEQAFKTSGDPALKEEIAMNKALLDQHLAIVRWLESPEG